jgi:hypothetical protein
VGCTPYDPFYEAGLSAAGAKFLRSFDAVEMFATTAYDLFGPFMKSSALVMRFSLFGVLLAGYHRLLSPIGGYFEKVLEAKKRARNRIETPAITRLDRMQTCCTPCGTEVSAQFAKAKKAL